MCSLSVTFTQQKGVQNTFDIKLQWFQESCVALCLSCLQGIAINPCSLLYVVLKNKQRILQCG